MCKIAPSAALDESDLNSIQPQEEHATLPPTDDVDKPILPKTRSCENLMSISGEHSVTSGGARRLSDPNIKADPNLLVTGQQQQESSSTETSGVQIENGNGDPANMEAVSSKPIVIDNKGECVKYSNHAVHAAGSTSTDTLVGENHPVPECQPDGVDTSISDSGRRGDGESRETESVNGENNENGPNDSCDTITTTVQCSTDHDETHLNLEITTNGQTDDGYISHLDDSHKSTSGDNKEPQTDKPMDNDEDKDDSIAILSHDEDSNIITPNGSIVIGAESQQENGEENSTTSQPKNCEDANDEVTPLKQKHDSGNKLVHYKAASISTSTSDISDSHVNIDLRSSTRLTANTSRLMAQRMDDVTMLGLSLGPGSRRQLNVELPGCSRDSSHGSSCQSEFTSTTGSLSPSSDKV